MVVRGEAVVGAVEGAKIEGMTSIFVVMIAVVINIPKAPNWIELLVIDMCATNTESCFPVPF